MVIRFVLCCVALFGTIMLSTAQEQKTEIKHATASLTSAASGQEMFKAYCASCHGEDAKGDGPAAAALKQAPADLTALAKTNGGKYPALKVTSVLRGQATLAAHGSQEMPVWGTVFWKMSGGHEAEVQQRISNLNRYIESLQEK
jgi:mono/diheme cytochrome c family protein